MNNQSKIGASDALFMSEREINVKLTKIAQEKDAAFFKCEDGNFVIYADNNRIVIPVSVLVINNQKIYVNKDEP